MSVPVRVTRCPTAGHMLMVALVALACTAATATGVEMNPSIMILGSFDWLPHSWAPEGSRCIDSVVRAAAAAGGSRLNFVPTMYWRDRWPADGVVDSYCYMDAAMNCNPIDHASITSFRDGMQRCFKTAADLGYSISIVPHLDDGSGQSAWRNGLVFSPSAKYGDFSYEDVLLNPLADALAAVMHPSTRVWFAMQGEMSATICRFPTDYESLHPQLKARIVATKPERAENVKVGVALNFNKLDHGNTGSPISTWVSLLLGRRPAAFSQPGIDATTLRKLFEILDFVGISSYAALTPDFKLSSLQDAAYMFFKEFTSIGIDLAALMKQRGIELQYSEYGLGGGISPSGTVKATSPEAAAKFPFFGVWGSYSVRNDPWQTPSVRDYMHSFYRRSLEWLAQGGGPTYPVTACFLWNLASWDVLAIYPDSTTKQGSFRDEEVAAMIRAHNTRVMGGKVLNPVLAPARIAVTAVPRNSSAVVGAPTHVTVAVTPIPGNAAVVAAITTQPGTAASSTLPSTVAVQGAGHPSHPPAGHSPAPAAAMTTARVPSPATVPAPVTGGNLLRNFRFSQAVSRVLGDTGR